MSAPTTLYRFATDAHDQQAETLEEIAALTGFTLLSTWVSSDICLSYRR